MTENARKLLIWACGFGFLSVVLGAFGAHALRSRLDAEALAVFQTAVRYQSVHALAIFAAVGWSTQGEYRWAHTAGAFFVIGTLLFSGSLYGLVLGGWSWMGPITPLGGVCFSAGWLMLLLSVALRR